MSECLTKSADRPERAHYGLAVYCARRFCGRGVPRAEARILTAVETARGELNAREGREPTVGELAQAVGVEPGLLGEMLAARDRMRRADGALDLQTACLSDEGFEDWVLLKDTLARLPSPYAQVLWLRFGQGWSQARLAERFGVGQPQISRWERRGKELLRQALSCPDRTDSSG